MNIMKKIRWWRFYFQRRKWIWRVNRHRRQWLSWIYKNQLLPYLRKKVVGRMKETILYISKTEKDIVSFLKYLQSKLEAEQKECTMDEEHNVLKVPKYYDIVGKSIHGNMLGTGYGYCKYYCFSEAYDRNKYSDAENEKLKDILMHTREGAERISGLDILCMLGLV